ncbi:hypothetical protein CPB83DRAFT_98189 [Crepidotus variabilis]|uniref:Uncharacterized protein n=1 Tax=Crepidotus variabilis TaxID=179855 RepID=A0A9P6EM38_9AGAR|nr:hypothetical protein CPB83DRAFT_98189 [Crepidotus variabilis]
MTNYISVSNATYPNVNFELWLIGVLIATIGYGVVSALVFSYLHDFIKLSSLSWGAQKRRSRMCQRWRRYFFLIYTIFLFSVSTLAFIAGTLGVINMLFHSPEGLNNVQNAFSLFGEASSMVLASWSADALMIWRCLILYDSISKIKRTSLASLLGILSLMSLVSGTAYVVTSRTMLNASMIAFVVAAGLLNITITILIVSRIWYHQKYIQNALGSTHTSMYTRLTHLFVESSALVAVFSLTHVGLVRWRNYALVISHQLLVHIYIISTLLILYRVAYGVQQPLPESTTTRHVSQLRFSEPALSSMDSVSIEDKEAGITCLNDQHS